MHVCSSYTHRVECYVGRSVNWCSIGGSQRVNEDHDVNFGKFNTYLSFGILLALTIIIMV